MTVTVLLPGVLRDETGGQGHLTAAPGLVRDVLAELAAAYPRLDRRIRDERGELRRYINVYVNGEPARLTDPAPDGAEIHVLPSVAGG